MNVVSIDTSTQAVAVACGSSVKDSTSHVVAQRSLHSENILTAIQTCLYGQGISPKEIDVVGVGVGPGLFTGLRVGMTAAHALAQALDIPLVSFSSLELAALSALSTDRVRTVCGKLIVAKDARRSEVYTATFENTIVDVYECTVDSISFASTLKRELSESLLSPSELVSQFEADPESCLAIDNLSTYGEFGPLVDHANVYEGTELAPASMIDVITSAHRASIHTDILTPRALYLRKSDAELSWGGAR